MLSENSSASSRLGKILRAPKALAVTAALAAPWAVFAQEIPGFPSRATDTPAAYAKREESATPSGILAWMLEGNARFANGTSQHGGFANDFTARRKVMSAGRQYPLAAVFTYMDSRVSPELVFDTAVGDLFTVRVGANVVNDDILGSLEFAGPKVIVVMGHTDCAGVKGACNGVKLGSLTQMLEKILPAKETVDSKLREDSSFARWVGEANTKNPRYVAEVSHANARQSARQLLERSETLREMVRKKETLLLSALFDLTTGRVSLDAEQN